MDIIHSFFLFIRNNADQHDKTNQLIVIGIGLILVSRLSKYVEILQYYLSFNSIYSMR
jgi:hypothetical protein